MRRNTDHAMVLCPKIVQEENLRKRMYVNVYILYISIILCVIMPLHDGQVGSLLHLGAPNRRSMTCQFDIDYRHYCDCELGTAGLMDINDHQESAERHHKRIVRQTTETSQRLKRVIVSWTKLEKHEKKDRQVS